MESFRGDAAPIENNQPSEIPAVDEAQQKKADDIFDRIFSHADTGFGKEIDNLSDEKDTADDDLDFDDLLDYFRKQLAEDESETDDAQDANDSENMTEDEINAKQTEAIKDGIVKLQNGELTDAQKGNLCEMMMDQYFVRHGYTPLNQERITSLDQSGHKGLDGVYEKDGHYVIADAKYGQSPLGDSADGKQMSDSWIDSRLDDAVGKEKADEIRDAYINDPDSVSKIVFHVEIAPDSGGTISETKTVDEDGYIVRGSGENVESYDRNGEVKEERS